MNIKNILKEIVTYYECTRQVGHTTAIIEGLREKSDTIVVTHSQAMNNHFYELYIDKLHPMTLESLGNGLLRGCSKSIVFDNAALFVLFKEILKEIEPLTSSKEKDVFDDIEVLSGDIEEVVIKGVRYKKVTETKTTWKKIS